MASTKADNNRVGWRYTDRKGVVYAVSAKNVYVNDVTDGAKYGGAAATTANRRVPKDLRLRKVKCIAPGQPDKWVVAYTTSATIYTTPGTQLTLNSGGVDVTYETTDQIREEKWRDTCRDTS